MIARTVFGVALVSFAIAGCSSAPQQKSIPGAQTSSSVATQPAQSSRCAKSDIALASLEPKSPAEPHLAIPQPSGWNHSSAMNSNAIRGLIFNKSLTTNEFTPTAVVTVADVTEGTSSPEQALETELGGIVQNGAKIESETSGTICGYPAKTVNYPIEGRPGSTLIVAAKHDRHIWTATVTIQTADAKNPTYIADKQTIFNGFQVTFPGQ
ncbi:LpqN/LpqT family lipoprotein [Mycobacteroides abscessus subsp. abscessus]|uniref:LpqN/LpqT family lipoprotein n=1 Tax=Mycobacteroides abscessus TaxID=36809 RepID=UPI0019D2ED8A|nr:LpqN/LpqT family lipoprotein [Mycobacteroides abscessus]MBN7438809.1 LpqN/LpqT family lipoprotein [Mycobacteroides abscessus subsp. abscessus]